MSNEMKFVYASQKTLEASGASIASAGFAQANDGSLATADTSDYPFADFVLNCAFGAAVAAGTYVNLYRQDMAINSSANALAPSASYKSIFVGSFMLDSATSVAQDYPCPDVPLGKTSTFWIENGTAQSISAGWKLLATPKSYVPGA